MREVENHLAHLFMQTGHLDVGVR